MENLRSITLKVDLSAGTDIREACCDICMLAGRVGCLVEANFNGVLLWAREGDNPLKLVNEYQKALKSNIKFKVAQC